MAHYGLGVVEQLERDLARLKGAFERTNWCPLGACAITGTGFPIDRGLTASLLGFAGPMGNTYGSIATVDYLLEGMAAVAVLLVGLGRVVQDLLFWSTAEVGYLRLGDGFVQTSSLMPQKRNPVAFEHARALASAAIGRAQAVALAVHNTPFGDIVDTEDDLQPLADSAFGDAIRAMRLLAAALPTVELDPADLEARARDGWATLTELADTLVRDHDLPFRTAHDVARRFMTGREQSPDRAPGRLLADASREVCGRPLEYADGDLQEILCPRRFVGVRTTLGGPAPAVTVPAARAARVALAADRGWWTARQAALRDADDRLAAACAAL
jgi:argininosuccinate lyase